MKKYTISAFVLLGICIASLGCGKDDSSNDSSDFESVKEGFVDALGQSTASDEVADSNDAASDLNAENSEDISTADESESATALETDGNGENVETEENNKSEVETGASKDTSDQSTSTEAQSVTFSTEDQSNASADNTGSASNSDTLRPEFVQAMNSYEDFMNEYCDFMAKYKSSSGSDAQLLADYATYMSKYAQMTQDFDKWNSEDMTSAETAYYIEVQSRVSQKLLAVSQ